MDAVCREFELQAPAGGLSKIIRIDFDDIWQKYSKYSIIEFACLSFRVGLLFD